MATEFKPNGFEYKPNGDTANGTNATPKKGGKLKAHFKRFWWLHLINVVVGTVLITCLLLFVGLPNIAQKGIDDSQLIVVSQEILDPTPEQITLKMTTKATSSSPFTPTLDAFNAVLFLENTEPNIKPFGNITIPSIHVSSETILNTTDRLIISDMEQFINYNTLVAATKKYRVALRGATKLHLGALPVVKVNFNKAIEMAGLDNLRGIDVNNINITLGSKPGVPNLHAMVNLPNPTVMTITLGTIVQNLFVEGKSIGNATIENVVLRPGMNLYPMTSFSDQATVIGLIAAKFQDGMLPVEARTESITYKDKRLPYFEEALKRAPVHLNLNVAPALEAIGVNLGALRQPGGAGPPPAGSPAPAPAPAPAAPLPSSAPPAPAAPSMSMSMPMV